MKKIKALFYDFDGVIKDSTDIKTDAFYALYLPFGKDIAEKAAAHHAAHGGVSRFEKIKYYHHNFLNMALSDQDVSAIADQFSKIVFQKVIACAYVAGANEALIKLSEKFEQYIVTGTPDEEIKSILIKLNIAQYFKKICGSPATKIEICDRLMKDQHLRPDEIVFIGDATTDYNAAQHYGIHFILREHFENKSFFRDKNVIRIPDLTTFEATINQFNQ